MDYTVSKAILGLAPELFFILVIIIVIIVIAVVAFALKGRKPATPPE